MSKSKNTMVEEGLHRPKNTHYFIMKMIFEIEMNYIFNSDLSFEEKQLIIQEIDKLSELVRAHLAK